MRYIPLEIQNIILSYIERPPTNKLIKYVINDCFTEDHDPYYAENWYDNYCFSYTFCEWYFMYRKKWVNKKIRMYEHTPSIILVGFDKINIKDRLYGK